MKSLKVSPYGEIVLNDAFMLITQKYIDDDGVVVPADLDNAISFTYSPNGIESYQV